MDIKGRGRISSEYLVWCHIHTRCNNPKNKDWANYGGRGITVCERWDDFENFLADMGLKPSPKHQIDRIDNDGNYEPSNCRWATKVQQANNTRRNRSLTIDWSQDDLYRMRARRRNPSRSVCVTTSTSAALALSLSLLMSGERSRTSARARGDATAGDGNGIRRRPHRVMPTAAGKYW
jgi:hypothetical protein